mmetsp:Transcript_28639/g.47370  ORF Transcript_28639/g.47370 Transcript_28639/m.47370 type:complete len:190 (+) Transcript_28639:569-1138(+)
MQEIRRHLEFNWGEGATGQDRLEHLNQVEVTDVRKEGYQRFSNLLRHQKLPRDSLFVPSRYVGTISPRDPNRARVPFVSWENLWCSGCSRCAAGGCSCTAATPPRCSGTGGRAWYSGRCNSSNVLKGGRRPVRGGLSLEPHLELSQEGYANFLASGNKVPRFEARLAGAGAFNATREFMVNYFLGDDTV